MPPHVSKANQVHALIGDEVGGGAPLWHEHATHVRGAKEQSGGTCPLVCMLGVSPAGWRCYMHVVGWVNCGEG